MSDTPSLVLDTNVLVSGIVFPQSLPGRVVQKGAAENTVLFSDASWNELTRVLFHPKFDRYAALQNRRSAFEELVGKRITVTRRVRACRDPKDDMILEVALNGKADLIISGDKTCSRSAALVEFRSCRRRSTSPLTSALGSGQFLALEGTLQCLFDLHDLPSQPVYLPSGGP